MTCCDLTMAPWHHAAQHLPGAPLGTGTFPSAAAVACTALVARSVGRQRRRAAKPRVQRLASTLDQLKDVTGKEGSISLDKYRTLVMRCR